MKKRGLIGPEKLRSRSEARSCSGGFWFSRRGGYVNSTQPAIEGCNHAGRLTQAARRALATGGMDRISCHEKISGMRVADVPGIAQCVDGHIKNFIGRVTAEIRRGKDCPRRAIQSRGEGVQHTIQGALKWATSGKSSDCLYPPMAMSPLEASAIAVPLRRLA